MKLFIQHCDKDRDDVLEQNRAEIEKIIEIFEQSFVKMINGLKESIIDNYTKKVNKVMSYEALRNMKYKERAARIVFAASKS